jgi:hypothetical protein
VLASARLIAAQIGVKPVPPRYCGLATDPTTQGGIGEPEGSPDPFLRGLYHFLPPDRITHILESTGRQSERVRRIPADAAARLVVALGLFADLPVP